MNETVEDKKADKKHKIVKLSDHGNMMPVDGPDVDPTQPPPFEIGPSVAQKPRDEAANEMIRAAAIAKAEAEVWLKRQQEERDALQAHLDETLVVLEAANKRGDTLQLELVDLKLELAQSNQDRDIAREEARYAKSLFATVKHRALRQVEEQFAGLDTVEQP